MISVLTISGMIAVHSKRAVFTALSGVPGVAEADVELGRAVVDHDACVTRAALAEALSVVGCELVEIATERRLPVRE
jgi:copper chaperone CopZ